MEISVFKRKLDLSLNFYLYVAAGFICFFFLSNAFVLSNYGYILEFLGVPNSHPFIGTPNLIPGVDLETYIYTPEFQILVNNDFQRINHTSPFGEDLKSLYSLPILDWGLIFKPNLWSFFVLPPAYAFSLFHLISIVMFIVGYYKLARLLGAEIFYSVIFSVALFFTGFVQVWWILFGATIALFPWIILLLSSQCQLKPVIKYTFLYYVLTCWLISNFYPPLIIILAFVGGLLYFVIEPKFYKGSTVLLLAVASILAVITTVSYLWEPINAIKNSVYPGNRVASGGSDFPAHLWLSQVFPTLLQAGSKTLISVEMAEAAAITTYMALVVFFFKDFTNWFSDDNQDIRKALSILMLGLACIWAWMLLPLPSWVGKIFLWDHVQPRRMVAGSGILIFAVMSLIAGKFTWKITLTRCAVFSAVILLPWLAYKYPSSATGITRYIDLLPILFCFLCFAVAKIFNAEHSLRILALSALIVNMATFGRLNPIQSAKNFFDIPQTDALVAIQEIAKNSPNGMVALERFEGAVVNGLGFRSAGHALLTPQPHVYRPYFSSLSEEQFNYIFNRTASVRVFYNIQPNSGGLGVNVPIDVFGANLEIRKLLLTSDLHDVPRVKELGGEVSSITVEDGKVTINGWARWSGINGEQSLHLYSDDKIENASLRYSVNGRGGEHILSSFYLVFDLPFSWKVADKELRICLVSYDVKFGAYLLENKKETIDCKNHIQLAGS